METVTKTYERITDHYVFFWGGPFSNWYPSRFDMEIDGNTITFMNTEQYFMYKKAVLFGDDENAKLILKTGHNPKAAKTLGRRVKNYDEKKWSEARFDIMKEANLEKFRQNKQLLEHMLSDQFKDKHFVEGSPYDIIWGIGCDWKEAKDDKSNWKGQNLLGKVLDEVREALSKETDQKQQ